MIWVIAGTLDGRTLAVDIQERTGEDVLVTVVSQYGAELAAHKGITVHTGRLDQQAMQNLIKEHNVRLFNRCKPSVRRSCDRNGTRGSQGSRYSIRSF